MEVRTLEGVSFFIQEIPDKKAQIKIYDIIELIKENGLYALRKTKDVRHYSDYDFDAIRVRNNKINYRIICIVHSGICYLYHSFRKNTRKTEKKDLETSYKRKQELIKSLKK